jgi:hypothetical protein
LAILITTPAAFWLALILLIGGKDYFWPVYRIVGGAFLIASLVIGYFASTMLPKFFAHYPGLSIFILGLLAWIAGLLVLGLLNLTPMCVGQDNGDGNNNLSLCIFQSVLVGIFYTPLELLFLTPSALIGGLLLKSPKK